MPKADRFPGSADYWRQRYVSGRDSGKGSYGRLAKFKAGVLNRFVAEHGVTTVIEFGSGDGAQLALARYRRYVGYDVSELAVEMCRRRFAADPDKHFELSDRYDGRRADLALSLDVVFHLVEDEVFESYMARLFDAADRFVIVYSTNFDRAPTPRAPHVRHREFTGWIEANRPDFRPVTTIRNDFAPGTGGGDTSPADVFVYTKDAAGPQ